MNLPKNRFCHHRHSHLHLSSNNLRFNAHVILARIPSLKWLRRYHGIGRKQTALDFSLTMLLGSCLKLPTEDAGSFPAEENKKIGSLEWTTKGIGFRGDRSRIYPPFSPRTKSIYRTTEDEGQEYGGGDDDDSGDEFFSARNCRLPRCSTCGGGSRDGGGGCRILGHDSVLAGFPHCKGWPSG